MRNTIIEILNSINPNVDFSGETSIVNKGYLDSFDIVRLVSLLSDEFDVEFTAAELIPENFNSVDGMIQMIERLKEDS